MISLITIGTWVGSSWYVHELPPNALLARSRIPCATAQLTVIAPGNGCAKVNVYGPAPEPVTLVTGVELISKSPALTPTTDSLNVTEIWLKLATVSEAAGKSWNT